MTIEITKKKVVGVLAVVVACFILMANDDCDRPTAQSASGIGKVSVQVPKGPDNLTTEQRNVGQRLMNDNKPGAIKHLYVISPYSGQVIMYSTVKGKVTSSNKRLTPSQVTTYNEQSSHVGGFRVDVGSEQTTTEVLGDDGTYGPSGEYIYWWDIRGAYHQLYLGPALISLSDQPLPVKSVTINIENTTEQ
jgi:hypothetical protein